MSSLKTPLPYPLPFEDLSLFCHPVAGHVFSRPRLGAEREVLVANGHLALRCHRGSWLDTDFLRADEEFLTRFHHAKLPWGIHRSLPDNEWRALDDVRGHIYRSAPVAPWRSASGLHAPVNGRTALSPTPVWRVGSASPVRLSFLQLIARLPRCEVYIGEQGSGSPLLFRFGGGVGIIAENGGLREPSFSLYQPKSCPLNGYRLSSARRSFRGWGNVPSRQFQAEREAMADRVILLND